MAKTDRDDVQKLEAKLVFPELADDSQLQSQRVLLEDMAESVGIPPETLESSMPLPPTLHSVRLWNNIAENEHWIEIMASLNFMDLVYSPSLAKAGAKLPYFAPSVLENEWIPDEVKTFLTHSVEYLAPIAEQSLALATKYAEELGQTEELQSVFLRSLEAFDRHLMARVT
ncbi:TENA/THI-4 domain-containing protein, partial [mine drainage metagenome]